MKVYLLRRVSTNNILGLFWAANKYDLWWSVDEWGDPLDYEHAELKHSGSIAFPREEPEAIQYDASDDESEDGAPEFTWEGAANSENLANVIYCMDNFQWIRLPYSNQPGGGAYELCRRVNDGRISTTLRIPEVK